ncbi:uncharacterized protein LOC123669695 [Melitaea cinxia]|uniref:uncharacterized protein LOC123669695 n=1 Tax=Melitaea cinxia TaxID=113334 RepID=UPI001E26E9F8|nr:uncharacterized protein LOC123669695 [Melitaea cinxia]
MDGLLNVLKDLQNVITRGLTNFKKCNKDKLTVEYIEARQELLEKDWSLFKDTNTKIYEKFKIEDIGQKVVDIYDGVEDTYIMYKSLMKTTLNKISVSKCSVQGDSNSSSTKSPNSFVKLPKIAIPIFSGKYGEWTTFHDLFISLVHKNESLDNVQKLHYLKSHLSGEAEQLIRHTPISDANYSECWALALECMEPKNVTVHRANKSADGSHSSKSMLATSSPMRCEYCSEFHKLCFCKRFAKEPIETRRNFVKNNSICFNCLGSNHSVYNCKRDATCRVCKKRHHSLLHIDHEANQSSSAQQSSPSTNSPPIVSCLSTGEVTRPSQVLLATALVKIESRTGEYYSARALLDQGSQACFVTEATVQCLRLKKIPIQGLISGLGKDESTVVKHMVYLTIQSRIDPEFVIKVKAYVLKKITSYLPERSIETTLNWLDTTKLFLADPGFKNSNKIDILLGADAYSYIIKNGIIKNPYGNLIAQNTTLGWVLSGTISTGNMERSQKINVMHVQVNEDDILKKFWEIEEQSGQKKILTPEEKQCEEFYSSTTRRDESGRYIVRLPFKEVDLSCKSGNSRAIAEKRLISLERKLRNDKDLKKKYCEVIHEYLELGHMRLVEAKDLNKEAAVYLPHHAVVRDDKATTKVRVVFNASQKNSNGVSLNDTLMVGPTLQADLRHTVLRWRVYSIALVADIIKMYRQIKVAETDVMFQRVLWRDDPEKEIRDYELTTVTFGTASAPYQAVRTLHQVALDEGENYPLAKDKVLSCFYMDDLMTGCYTVDTAIEIYKQVTGLLGKGGFELQKWNSNNQEIIDKIKSMECSKGQINKYRTNIDIHKDIDIKEHSKVNKIDSEEKGVEIKMDNIMKILGLTWNRKDDTFQYTVNLPPTTTAPVTKRSIISNIARLFDPLGWLAPSVILAKVFIQKLWLAGVDWDEKLSTELVEEWNIYHKELSLLTCIRIPRWLGTKLNDELELHGFSDASKTAYSAVIYLRIMDHRGEVHVSLLVAKTRVAPVKQVSIPRLELCGAVLLAQLLNETAEVLKIPEDNIRAWTDSTVVLAWINSHPSRWKTFVANRTSEILNNIKASQWFHVSTKNNPADIASRGILPSSLLTCDLWFRGPAFLKATKLDYSRPTYKTEVNVDMEESVKTHVALVPESGLFERFSTLTKLLRTIAYCRRFLKQNKIYHGLYLQKVELDGALECCIRQTQKEIYTKEYTQLKDKGYLQLKSSSLKSLSPYLDAKGIIRVAGRLEKSQLSDQMKHPILLPHSSHLTRLIIDDAHKKTLHGGLQLMINYLRTAYWIKGVRNLVKYQVHKCVKCARQRAKIQKQFMGSLPSVRCTPARPFLHSGVDYAGPINIRTTKGRGHRSYKGYICLFVCMVTRALHLEAVSDMSTQSFLAAFRRFVSRRGHCAKLWSDNSTTFVGASRELQDLVSIQPSIAEHLEANGTEWHFIPPHSPNFGGLWEAGVKSTKFHVKRVIGDATLTFEEITTLLSQVEACLNSRPISIIHVDEPGEPLPLTPGHFLIGEPLVSVPDNQHESPNLSLLSRWQFVQGMVQSFWKRWYNEYLSNLMNRYKWSYMVPEPKIGDIVLIKEDDLPPSRWLLGRILEKHPGDDGITRVVTLRTKSSTIKRPTSKICILPVAE